MQLQEYKEIIKDRLLSLPPEEQKLIADLDETETGRVLMSVLGTELFDATQEVPMEQPPAMPGLPLA